MSNIPKKRSLLVVTSTFPRWVDDTEPAFVFELNKRLSKLGFDVDVIAPHAPGLERHEVIDGVKVYRYKYFVSCLQLLSYSGGIMSNIRNNKALYLLIPFFVLFQALAIWKSLKLKQYDAIHVHWIIPQGFICALVCLLQGKKSPPILCTSHGGDLFSLQSSFLTKIKKWTLKRMKKITVVSHFMRKYCLEKMPLDESKVSVISMGVDLDVLFVPLDDVKRKTNRVIFVGRFVEKKGVANLIEAVAVTRKNRPEIELVLVGDGPLKTTLEEKVKKHRLHDNVRFFGSVQQKDLPALYSSAAIAVTPSVIDGSGDQEGLGLVIIEALGCGCAVVASSLEAIKDIIVNGENGLLVEQGNVNALAEAIQQLLLSPEKSRSLAKNGIKSVRAKYNWDDVAKRYYELIMNIMNEKIIN